MIAITVFNSTFCNAHQVVERVARTTGYQLITDRDVAVQAAKLSGMSEAQLAAAFPICDDAKCNANVHGEAIGWLRMAIADRLSQETPLVLYGYSAFLVPQRLKNVLRVGLVSEMKHRIHEGIQAEGCSQQEMRDRILTNDLACADWVLAHTGNSDPWDRRLYDVELPVSSLGVGQCACRIVEQLCSASVQHTDASREKLKAFQLAAKAQTEISHWANCVSVRTRSNALTLSFNDRKQTLKEVAHDLRDAIGGIEGVNSVEIGFARSMFHESDVYAMAMHGAALFTPIMNTHTTKQSNAHEGAQAAPSILEPAHGNPEDAALADRIREAIAKDGYPVTVHAENGSITLTLTNHATMLQIVTKKLYNIVSNINGVENVEIGLGRTYHQTTASRKTHQQAVSRNLLRDDRIFAPYLSHRLEAPDESLSITVYDGKATLADEHPHETEVFVLDADLPGFNVGEVLQRVKSHNPGAKVFVLSELNSEDEQTDTPAMNVSAYLHKPVSADILGNAIRGVTADVH